MEALVNRVPKRRLHTATPERTNHLCDAIEGKKRVPHLQEVVGIGEQRQEEISQDFVPLDVQLQRAEHYQSITSRCGKEIIVEVVAMLGSGLGSCIRIRAITPNCASTFL